MIIKTYTKIIYIYVCDTCHVLFKSPSKKTAEEGICKKCKSNRPIKGQITIDATIHPEMGTA